MVMKTEEKMIVKGKRLDGRKPDELRKIEMKVGVIPNADAATTLMEHVVLELTCAKWTPNTIEIGAQGMGLLTVPTQGRGPIIDWPINQPVAAGVPIKMRGKNVTADTPVGVSVLVYGIFE